MVAPVVRSKVLFCSLAASFLWCRANVVWASAVEDYLYEFTQMQKTDPNGFYLMVAGVSLIAFLALTIFAGFMFYLYKGWGAEQAEDARHRAAAQARAGAKATDKEGPPAAS